MRIMDRASIESRLEELREGRVHVRMLPEEQEGFMRLAGERGGDRHRLLQEEVSLYSTLDAFDRESGDSVASSLVRQIALLREGYNMFEPLPSLGDAPVTMECILGSSWYRESSAMCRAHGESDEAFLRRVIVNMQLSDEQKQANMETRNVSVSLTLPVDLLEQIATITQRGRGRIEDTLGDAVDLLQTVRAIVTKFAPQQSYWDGRIG